jgi:hypothetical protein
VEERRAFHEDDLPLSGMDVKEMAPSVQDFISTLMGARAFVPLALEIINRNLDNAIAQMLNFTGDQLQKLMTEIRQYLRREGKELVLLIEDFARLQGVDGALLQALIEAPGTGEDALCNLRWAMAVTRGYYEKLSNTVQTRMTMVLDMDLPTRGKRAVLHETDIVTFAARYLNAARLSETALQRWYGERRSTGEIVPPPNACHTCEYVDTCHATFKTTDDLERRYSTRAGI